MSSTYIDGFTVNKTTHDICNYQNKKEKIWQLHLPLNMTHSDSYCFFTAHMIFINLLLNKLCFEF
jgi:hypothetical protein